MSGDDTRINAMASHDCKDCCGSIPVPSVCQTIDEMEFERGLWSSALSGEIEELTSRISKGSDVNARDKSGYTALHYAARSGHLDACRLLVNHGADVNATTSTGQATPLHRAAYMGHTDVVQLLLCCRANPHLADSDSMTALHKAAERGHSQIVEVLLNAAPSTAGVRDTRGRTACDMTSSLEVKALFR